MSNARRIMIATLLLTAVAGFRPAVADDALGRSYSLHTLDSRIAESLVWDICEDYNNGPDFERCMVQQANPGGLTVLAPREVHRRVTRMLSERDVRLPSSLLFEIVLVRLADGRGGGGSTPKLATHLQKALEAVREVFPDRRPEIIDTGLVRTAGHGRTRVGSDEAGYFDAEIQVRSAISGKDGMEFTVDLNLATREGDKMVGILQSVLTLGAGETVVAGSSRIGGAQAIVILLTSNPL